MKTALKIGTRASPLALYQAELVRSQLEENFPGRRIEIVKIRTSGDEGSRRPEPAALESKRIYTKEIEEALLDGRIDVAVHSAKDLAAVMPVGLKIGAVLEREDSRDCLVTADGLPLSRLRPGAQIGTSSLRRQKQAARLRPDLILKDVHGNVGTRLEKLKKGGFDGLILAYAGLIRLELADEASEIFETDSFLPAPGQGIIIAQQREDDGATGEALEACHHGPSGIILDCERAFLKRLDGGCQLPCGMTSVIEGDRIRVRGILFETAGGASVEQQGEGPLEAAVQTGTLLAETILKNGGSRILDEIKK